MASADIGVAVPLALLKSAPTSVPWLMPLTVIQPAPVTVPFGGMMAVLGPSPSELAIVNGGAETNDLTGWTVDSGSVSTTNLYQCQGTYSFNAANGVIHQDVALDTEQLTFAASGEYIAVLEYCVGSSSSSYANVDVSIEAYDGATFLQGNSTSPVSLYNIATSLTGLFCVLPLHPDTTTLRITLTWTSASTVTINVGHVRVKFVKIVNGSYPVTNTELTNAGAELGNLDGWWDVSQIVCAARTYPYLSAAYSGTYFFGIKGAINTTFGGHGGMWQFYALTPAERATLSSGGSIDFSLAYANGTASSSTHQKFYFDVKVYDDNSVEVGSYSDGPLWSSGWTVATHTFSTVPSNTAYMLVRLRAWTDQAESYERGVFVDSIAYDVISATSPTAKDHKHSAYCVIEPPKTLKTHAEAIYALITERISFEVTTLTAYVLQYVPQHAAIYKETAYCVLGDPYAVVYSMVDNALLKPTPHGGVGNMQSLATIRPQIGGAISSAQLLAVMRNPNYTHLFVYSLQKYCAFVYTDPVIPSSMYNYAATAYAVIKRAPVLTQYQTSGYCVWYPDPRLYNRKQAAYAVIKVSPYQERSWVFNTYVTMVFEGDLRVRNSQTYAVLAKLPPLRDYSAQGYALVVQPGYLKDYAKTLYSILYRTLMHCNRLDVYAVLPANNVDSKTLTSYALLHTLEVFRDRSQAAYAVLEYVMLPDKARTLTGYCVLGGTDPLVRVRNVSAYMVIGEHQPVAKLDALSAYLAVGPFPVNNMLTFALTSYIVYEAEYTRTFAATAYVVLNKDVPWYIKQYKAEAYVVRGIPDEQPNTTYDKITGRVQ